MEAVVSQRRGEIERLCRRFHVRRLDLFGSAATGHFDPQHSDVDLLVEFEPLSPGEYVEAFFGLREELERLLGLPVDLVTEGAARNPYFRASVERSRQALYAA